MRRLMALACLCLILLLGGCGSEPGVDANTYVVSGTVVDRSHRYYTTRLAIELDNGMTVPVWEMHTGFSDYVEEGDYVSFKVQKVESGYRIVGLGFEEG